MINWQNTTVEEATCFPAGANLPPAPLRGCRTPSRHSEAARSHSRAAGSRFEAHSAPLGAKMSLPHTSKGTAPFPQPLPVSPSCSQFPHTTLPGLPPSLPSLRFSKPHGLSLPPGVLPSLPAGPGPHFPGIILLRVSRAWSFPPGLVSRPERGRFPSEPPPGPALRPRALLLRVPRARFSPTRALPLRSRAASAPSRRHRA